MFIASTRDLDAKGINNIIGAVQYGGFSNAETQYVFTQLFYEEGKTVSGTEDERIQKARDYVASVLADPFWAEIGINVDAVRFDEIARAADAAQFKKNDAALM